MFALYLRILMSVLEHPCILTSYLVIRFNKSTEIKLGIIIRSVPGVDLLLV